MRTQMKQCKDCVRQLICHFFYELLDNETATDYPDGTNCVRYSRVWWKRWVPKVLLITLALLLDGCSHTEATYKDGVATVKRTRVLMTEDIGSFSYDATDGSFTLDGYKSDLTKALDLIKLLADKDERKAVKP